MTSSRVRSLWRCVRPVISALMLGVLTIIGGCDNDSGSVDQRVEKAEKLRAAGDYQAAAIELKNALAKDPKSLPANLLAVRLELDGGSGNAALGILRRLIEEGANERDLLKMRAEAALQAVKHEEVLNYTETLPEELAPQDKASMLGYRGSALVALRRLDEARAVLVEARALDVGSVDVLAATVRLEFAAGNVPAAQRVLENALAGAPHNLLLRQLDGDMAIHVQDYSKAEQIFKRIVDTSPWNAVARAGLALAQVGGNKPKEAIATLEAVPDEETQFQLPHSHAPLPKYPMLNYVRALASYRLNDFEDARNNAELVVLAIPHFPPARLIAGLTSYQLREYERAHYYLSFYVGQMPTDRHARKLLSSTQLLLNRPDRALETLKPALQQAETDPELLALAGVAAERSGDAAAASRYLADALQQRPDDDRIRLQLGRAQLLTGETKASIEAFQRVAQANPDAPGPQTLLFLAYVRNKSYDDALASAERVQRLRPDDPIGFVMAGAGYLARGDRDAARTALLKARERRPGDINSNRNLATLAIGDGKLNEARQYYRDILKENPKDTQTYLDLAAVDRRIGEPDQADATLASAVQKNPDDPTLHSALAGHRLMLGNLNGALAAAQPALKKFPDDPQLLHIVGWAQLSLGQNDAALQSFQDLARKEPKSAIAHIDMAEAYLAMHRPGRPQWPAISEAGEAVSLEPNNKAAKLVLVRALVAHDRFAQARELVDKLKAAYPKDAIVLRLDGMVAQGQGRLAEAAAIFAQLVAASDNGEDRRLLAEAQLKQGRPEEAGKTLKDWLDGHPSDTAMRKLWANFCVSTGKLAEASAEYAELAKQKADDAIVRNDFALLLLRLDRPEEALARAREALAIAPDSADVRDTLGVILLKSGQADAAVDHLEHAWNSAPDQPNVGFHLAQALVAVDRKDEALLLLRRLLIGEAFRERAEAQKLLRELGG